MPQPGQKPESDVQQLGQHIQQNPALYIGGVLFIGLAIVAGLTINLGVDAAKRSEATAVARALTEEDASLRGQNLLDAVPAAGDFAPDALFQAGNSFYEAGEFEKARTAFERLVNEHPESDLAADGYEGLGYVAEELGEYEQALAQYNTAAEKAGSYAARRQAFNIGRVHERLLNFEAAKEAYEEQTRIFPGSVIAQNATAALMRLEQEHPELFPAETAETPPEPQDTVEPADAPANNSETAETPAEAPDSE